MWTSTPQRHQHAVSQTILISSFAFTAHLKWQLKREMLYAAGCWMQASLWSKCATSSAHVHRKSDTVAGLVSDNFYICTYDSIFLFFFFKLGKITKGQLGSFYSNLGFKKKKITIRKSASQSLYRKIGRKNSNINVIDPLPAEIKHSYRVQNCGRIANTEQFCPIKLKLRRLPITWGSTRHKPFP